MGNCLGKDPHEYHEHLAQSECQIVTLPIRAHGV